MLKASLLSAVNASKRAVQDLAVLAVLIRRGDPVHVPGSAPTYPEVTEIVSIVPVAYKISEIDGDRIKASDIKGLVFPEAESTIALPNDIIRIAQVSSAPGFPNGDYRVILNDKVMAGDMVALSQLQLRRM